MPTETAPTYLHTDLSWNGRKGRLEGTLLGVENAKSGRGCAYQGELCTGRVVTVHWDGTVDLAGPVLYDTDTRERRPGDSYAYRWFARLQDVS